MANLLPRMFGFILPPKRQQDSTSPPPEPISLEPIRAASMSTTSPQDSTGIFHLTPEEWHRLAQRKALAGGSSGLSGFRDTLVGSHDVLDFAKKEMGELAEQSSEVIHLFERVSDHLGQLRRSDLLDTTPSLEESLNELDRMSQLWHAQYLSYRRILSGSQKAAGRISASLERIILHLQPYLASESNSLQSKKEIIQKFLATEGIPEWTTTADSVARSIEELQKNVKRFQYALHTFIVDHADVDLARTLSIRKELFAALDIIVAKIDEMALNAAKGSGISSLSFLCGICPRLQETVIFRHFSDYKSKSLRKQRSKLEQKIESIDQQIINKGDWGSTLLTTVRGPRDDFGKILCRLVPLCRLWVGIRVDLQLVEDYMSRCSTNEINLQFFQEYSTTVFAVYKVLYGGLKEYESNIAPALTRS